MTRYLEIFERIIVLTLLGMMMIAVFLSTIELGVIIYKELMKPPVMLLDVKEMLEVFGFFLMVLIGLELIESIKAYLHDEEIHVEIVLLVAIVAVSRKIIIFDYKKMDVSLLYGMAALVMALGIAYYLVRKALYTVKRDEPKIHTDV